MRKTISFEQLHCVLLPAKGRFCKMQFYPQYQQAFDFWFEHTKSALIEEKNNGIANHLSSDGFLECDESAVIFHNDKPVGIFMFRWFDLNFAPNNLLSAIEGRFPASLITELSSNNATKIMTMGNLVVHPDYRRNKIGFGISDLLMHFALTRFLESDAHALLTTTRNNRSTNTLCYRQGGQKYAENDKTFGVASDIVLFYRDNVTFHPLPEINQRAKNLWQSKCVGWIDMPLNFIGRNYAKEELPS